MTTKVMDCDLVVLGAGGSGLVSAVRASDLSGKKVIVLEKAKKTGGSSIFAGVWGELGAVMDSKWQKDAGYKVNDPPDITGVFFDWLVSKGGAETFFKVAKPEEKKYLQIYMPNRLEKYKDLPDPSIGPGKLGSYVVDKMLECCQKAGIQVLTETRARKLIMDNNGKVIGVMADTKEGHLLVNCKACIIAAGGFGANKEKLKKYWPQIFNNTKMHSLCPPTMTGDCIDAAEDIGAAIDQVERKFPGGFLGDGPMHHPYSFCVASLSGGVSVNLDGKSWRVEGTGSSASIADQPGGVAYSILDSDMIETMGPKLAENARADQREEWRIAILKRWREELAYEVTIDEEGASGNHTKKADTFTELALKMKINPKTFVETMESYNKSCETGKDSGRPGQRNKPIVKPPFYAIFGHRWSQCTKGLHGICVNSKFEVLDAKGVTISGLYAVGDTCTIFGGLVLSRANWNAAVLGKGQDYPKLTADTGTSKKPSSGNILSGEGSPCGGLGPAMIAGYYAGTNAADYLKNI
jgi:succinate dehydrogenase/fumarate reductase flavoprotein subunit